MKCPNDGMTLVTHPHGILHCPICPFNVPGNTKILESLFAWVSVDENGREGFMAAQINGNMLMLCHSERHKAMELEDMARDAVKTIPGYHARLIKFSNREIVKDE